jgi:hypothetical protein
VTGRGVREVGLCADEGALWACSPDGLVDPDGGLEIKCPKASTMVGYYRDGACPSEYVAQVQGCLWITGRAWWDFFVYHPSMRPYLIRVERDEPYIEKLSEAVSRFVDKLLEQREALKDWRMK